jgi:hypothetical protein
MFLSGSDVMSRRKKITKFLVTRRFTAGILQGLTHTAETAVKFEVGFRCERPCGGSPYVITAVEEIANSVTKSIHVCLI